MAVFVATRDERAAWGEGGRAYERFALQAAALNLRSAFIHQPIAVRLLRPPCASWLGLNGAQARRIVRIGRAPLAPCSLRRPVGAVIVP